MIHYRFSLRKIAAFLGFEDHQGRIDCAVNFSTGWSRKNVCLSQMINLLLVFVGQFKRKHKDLGKNLFTPQQKQLVEDSIRKLNIILKKSQKESLPLSKYEMFDELQNWSNGFETRNHPRWKKRVFHVIKVKYWLWTKIYFWARCVEYFSC